MLQGIYVIYNINLTAQGNSSIARELQEFSKKHNYISHWMKHLTYFKHDQVVHLPTTNLCDYYDQLQSTMFVPTESGKRTHVELCDLKTIF